MRIPSIITFVLLIIVALILSGCATAVPVAIKFPEPPGKAALTRCPNLEKLPDNVKLSDISHVITVNYTTYYECAIKADAWQEWYQIQKNIFEKAVE
jgi:hypothetical protein